MLDLDREEKAAAARSTSAASAPAAPWSYECGFALGRPGERRFRLRLARYPAIAKVIDPFIGDRAGLALDAGVGSGRLAQYSLAPRLRWFGIDVNPRRLSIARKTGRYDLVRADIERLPFPPRSFDVVACIQVLEHFELEPARAIARELGERVRTGGLMLLSVPIFPSTVLALKRMADRALRLVGLGPIEGEGHRSHFSLSAARRLLPPNFSLESIEGQRFLSLPGKLFENRRWWFELHRWWGSRFPQWSVEVNLAARRMGEEIDSIPSGGSPDNSRCGSASFGVGSCGAW